MHAENTQLYIQNELSVCSAVTGVCPINTRIQTKFYFMRLPIIIKENVRSVYQHTHYITKIYF